MRSFSGGTAYGFAAFFLVLGLALLWAGTWGKEWNNTHNRAFRRVPHRGSRQSAYNTWAARVVGALLVGLSIAMFAGVR